MDAVLRVLRIVLTIMDASIASETKVLANLDGYIDVWLCQQRGKRNLIAGMTRRKHVAVDGLFRSRLQQVVGVLLKPEWVRRVVVISRHVGCGTPLLVLVGCLLFRGGFEKEVSRAVSMCSF